METWNNRTVRLLGTRRADVLTHSSVLIVGLGGVGGYAAEMLVRTGVGNLTLVDADNVAESNINRQLIALRPTVGMPKTLLFAERFHEINPEAEIHTLCTYVEPANVAEILTQRHYDYVIDAIDTVAPKTALITHCQRNGIPLISSMGAGGRVDPTRIGYFDLWETREDGLARAVRQRLKKEGLRSPLRVVASTEKPVSHSLIEIGQANKRSSYGTIAPIPAMFGIYLAIHVIRSLCGL